MPTIAVVRPGIVIFFSGKVFLRATKNLRTPAGKVRSNRAPGATAARRKDFLQLRERTSEAESTNWTTRAVRTPARDRFLPPATGPAPEGRVSSCLKLFDVSYVSVKNPEPYYEI